MKTFYYVNGKRVSADTYFATGKNLEWKKYMYKACISYYKAHPDKIDAIARWTPQESLFTRLMFAWGETDDYQEAEEKFEKRYRRNMLITLIIAAFFCFVLPVIVITCGGGS
mgnify:FL=1